MSLNNEPCPGCPTAASIQVSKEFSEAHNGFYSEERSQKSAQGSIAQEEILLRGIIKAIGCNGPNLAEGGYAVCPHSRTVSDTRARIGGPPPQLRNEFNYISLLGEEEDSTMRGQYL
jgi:hypothetical protein